MPKAGFARTLGPTPLPIRIDLDDAFPGPGQNGASVVITVTPAASTTVSLDGASCVPLLYAVQPTFDGGLQLGVETFTGSEFGVAVLGLSWQPVVLSTLALPCVLLPAQDVFVFLPSLETRQVDVPPSLRPIVFDTQAVIVDSPLATTSAYRVVAQ